MNPQNADIDEVVVLRTKADVNKFTGEEYRADLLRHFTPKTWEEICEEEEEFLRIVEEEEEREREEEEEDQKEVIRRHEDLERKRHEDLERKRHDDLERKRHDDLERERHDDLERERQERELKELTDIRKALFADGKYVLEEGEILE